MSKEFENSTIENFLSKTSIERANSEKVKSERKTYRLTMLVAPTKADQLKTIASMRRMSVSAVIDEWLDKCVEKYKDDIRKYDEIFPKK